MCLDVGLCWSYTKNWFKNRGNIGRNNKEQYIIPYKHNGVNYLMPLVVKRGPRCIIHKATDQDGNDITSELVKYAGPYCNFNGIALTPKMMGYKSIIITWDETTRNFNATEVISFNEQV